MIMRNKIVFNLVLILMSFVFCAPQVFAQATGDPSIEMADAMRSEGKIYVVVLVIAILFTGLLIYIINTDRKVTRLEKEMNAFNSGKDS